LPKKVSILTLHNQRAAVFEVLIKNEACFLPCDVTKTGKPLAFSGQWIVEEKEMTCALLQHLCWRYAECAVHQQRPKLRDPAAVSPAVNKTDPAKYR